MITCSNFLINELDLQVEDLFMYFTVGQLQFLSPAYHVAEISYLWRITGDLRGNKKINPDIVYKLHQQHYMQNPW